MDKEEDEEWTVVGLRSINCFSLDEPKLFSFFANHSFSSIRASYQISVNLATRFKRRRFFLEITRKKIAYGGHVC
jgi:hypothetical protein